MNCENDVKHCWFCHKPILEEDFLMTSAGETHKKCADTILEEMVEESRRSFRVNPIERHER